MSLIFGITGSIACGKSTVTKFMRKAGIPVVDADIVAREVVVPGSEGLTQLINTFGTEYLSDDGTLNRPKLASLVFEDASQLTRINQIMFPLIHDESHKQMRTFVEAGHEFLIYDAALIIEQGNADNYRPLVVVVTPKELQLTRLMARNKLSEAEALARIDKQLSSEEKVKYADYVIETTGTLDELEQKTLSVLSSIKANWANGNQRTAS